MKKCMLAKLKSRAGESITEVLVALVISSLGLVLLATGIMQSAKLITESKDRMNSYLSGENALISPETASSDTGTVTCLNESGTLSLRLSDDAEESIPVVYYTNTDAETVMRFTKEQEHVQKDNSKNLS